MNEVIVSLTSYPARIHGIARVLDSIMEQTYKPDKVVIYLSEEQFTEKKLPVDLSAYYEQGLEIHWCQGDMKSHKKYLYAFQEYSDDYIITIDDDFFYEKHMIEELVRYVDEFPQCILARRTHLITAARNGSISLYEKWWNMCTHYIGVPRMDLFATTGAGTLYAPHLLGTEVFHINNIRKYCMYADDIWLKVMELISEVPVVQVPTRFLDRFDEHFAKDGLYWQHNKNGGNDKQLQAVLEVYDSFNKSDLTLTQKIFSTGVIYEDEVIKKQKDDNFRIVQEWLDRICRGKDIVIYGAGTVAKRIYGLLKRHKVVEKIRFFVVEDTDKNVDAIDGIKVVQYRNADYTDAVCVIALTDLIEQYRVGSKLQEIGLAKDRILFLNRQLYCALYDFEKG